ncbi:hypothetical protein Fcan01_01980 [Folsomia candida]|uniref:Uncharacterized protein n=1 Tax=Folsomia candida TaxID=158441 RepID=A0A226F4A2_FOLCA|nr:hypothetical protein Fcan01_01980 [Folsomia candida]
MVTRKQQEERVCVVNSSSSLGTKERQERPGGTEERQPGSQQHRHHALLINISYRVAVVLLSSIYSLGRTVVFHRPPPLLSPFLRRRGRIYTAYQNQIPTSQPFISFQKARERKRDGRRMS